MADKLNISQIVIVEGKYDKIRLSNVINSPAIITTDGFGIYKNKEKQELIKRLSMRKGVIILTDSDDAGRQIRSFVKNLLNIQNVKIFDVYVPEFFGKEHRKAAPSKSGLIGVEGIDDKIIAEAFVKFVVNNNSQEPDLITRERLFDDGLIGGNNSVSLRKSFFRELELPQNMSVNSLLDIINVVLTLECYEGVIKMIKQKIA